MGDQKTGRSVGIRGVAVLVGLLLSVVHVASAQDMRTGVLDWLNGNKPNTSQLYTAFRTLRNTNPPPAELAAEFEARGREFVAVHQTGRDGELRRLLYEGMTRLIGEEWTPRKEYGLSLVVRSDMRVADPAQPLIIHLGQLYEASWEFSSPAEVVVELTESSSGWRRAPVPGETIRDLGRHTGLAVDLIDSPFAMAVNVSGVADGTYFLAVTVFDGAEPIRRFGMPIHLVDGLRAAQAEIEDRLRAVPDFEDAKASARYPFDFALQINLGRREARAYDFADGIRRSTEIVDTLEKGEDPFAGARGAMTRHHVLEETGEIIPFGLFVPSTYAGDKPMPLIVALHGLGGSEQTFLGRDDAMMPKLAEEHGYILATPLGYRFDGGWGRQSRGTGERARISRLSEADVLQVVDLVRDRYAIDDSRIYLTGHSMGGNGTWYLGAKHAEIWAAIAPIAGGSIRPADVDLARLAGLPILCAHGDADLTAPVETSRRMTARVRQAGGDCTLVEVEGGTHRSIVEVALPQIVEFFDKHAKAPTESAE